MSTSEVVAAGATPSMRAAPSRSKPKRRRFLYATLILAAALGYMIYSAIASNSEYYLTVSELLALGPQSEQGQVKIGGQVVDGTISWDRANNSVRFTVTDGQKTVQASYRGVVPDSFQPGADVILEGKLGQDGTFSATTMLAKCASKYEPQLPTASQ